MLVTAYAKVRLRFPPRSDARVTVAPNFVLGNLATPVALGLGP